MIKKKLFSTFVLVCAVLALFGTVSHAATQFDFLLSQVRTNAQGALTGGKVYFYAPGTTTLKTVWTTAAQASTAANPYTLDANATCLVYGNGTYRVVVKDAGGTTRVDRDSVLLSGANATYTVPGDVSLEEARSSSSYANSTIVVTSVLDSSASTISGIWPTDRTLKIESGGGITQATGFTINGRLDAGLYKVFYGTGTVRFGRGSVPEILPQWFGAMGDGSTDDTAALKLACDSAQVTNSGVHVINLGAGIFRYIDQIFTITVPVTIKGISPKLTQLRPTVDFDDEWTIEINDTWRGTGNTGTTYSTPPSYTMTDSSWEEYVTLENFSIIGDRSFAVTGVQNGIRTYGRVDGLRIKDVSVIDMTGTGVALGYYGAAQNNFIRESYSDHLVVRACGTQSESADAMIIGSNNTGEGSNQLYFYDLRTIYNYAPVRIAEFAGGTSYMRRLSFFNWMAHGLNLGTDTISLAPADSFPLVILQGDVRDVQGMGVNLNGSLKDSDGTLYPALYILSLNGDSPNDIQLNVDLRNCKGDGIKVVAVANLNITGTVENASIPNGKELIVGSNAFDTNYMSRYSVVGKATGRSIQIDSTVDDLIDLSGSRSIIVDTTAHLASSTSTVNTKGKFKNEMIQNSDTGKPVWAAGSGPTAVWKDATGSTAHTPTP